MKAVYKRELNSYFSSMIGYVYTAVVLIFLGLFFMLTNILGQYPYFAGALSSLTIILVFTVPILTMKSIAEERRSKTDQMLLTYPVKTSAVILGKYLAMVTVYAIPLAIGCLCPMILSWSGAGSFLIDYSTILAFLCLGALFVAIGMFISSLTESQVIAAVVTMGVYLLIFFWTGLVNYIPKTALASLIAFAHRGRRRFPALQADAQRRFDGCRRRYSRRWAGGLVSHRQHSSRGLLNRFLGAFSVTDAIGNFAGYSVFDLKGLLFFLSFAALFVFLTIQSLQKRRWS
jgi:ABC-2 type transport system permease protein